MREWKGRGGPGESTRGSRGGSNISRRPDASGRRGRSGGNWGNGGNGGNGGNDWQENDYDDEPPAGRSNRRNRRPAESYDEVDLGRALVPARNEMMAPMDASAGLPAVPGFPQTDEEERALGMRRPAYIPATNEKRKKKLSSWRVISGVLSVMLACIASCGAAGILGRDRIATIFGNPVKLVGTQIPLDLSNVPVTPVATAGPAAKSLTQVTTALHRQGNCVPVDPTSYFHNGDIIWVFVTMKTQAPGHSISVRWFLNGTYVDPPVQGPGHTVTVLKDGEAGACFQLQVPTPGEGTARLYWDRPANDVGDNPSDPALMATIYFAVVPPGYGTVTPGANGTTAPTAAPTGSPSK